MAWKIELTKEVAKKIRKLDKPVAKRLIQFLHERVSTLNNPRDIGEALTGSKLGEFWKYRVGDYRIIWACRYFCVNAIFFTTTGER